DFLYSHDKVRDAIVAEATVVAHDTSALHDRTKTVRDRVTQLNALHLPIGWNGMRSLVRRDGWTFSVPEVVDVAAFWRYVLAPVFGWLMTGLAVSLGAPFWFDVLNKIMVIRSTVKPK